MPAPWKSLALRLCGLEIAMGCHRAAVERGDAGAEAQLDRVTEAYCAALDELRAAARRELMALAWGQDGAWRPDDVVAVAQAAPP